MLRFQVFLKTLLKFPSLLHLPYTLSLRGSFPMSTFTIKPKCEVTAAWHRTQTTLHTNVYPGNSSSERPSYHISFPSNLPSLLPCQLRSCHFCYSSSILSVYHSHTPSHEALFGGERWQSLHESIHTWNVKNANCTIKDTKRNPALTLFFNVDIAFFVKPSCLSFCLFLLPMSWQMGLKFLCITDC